MDRKIENRKNAIRTLKFAGISFLIAILMFIIADTWSDSFAWIAFFASLIMITN